MAPEQRAPGRRGSARRADVFGLAATLLRRADRHAPVAHRAEDRFPQLTRGAGASSRAARPRALADVVSAGLDPDPAARPTAARRSPRALEPLVAALPRRLDARPPLSLVRPTDRAIARGVAPLIVDVPRREPQLGCRLVELVRRMARRNALAAGTLLGALVLVALHFWRGIEYWNYSEGVYAYTSRLFARRRRSLRAHRSSRSRRGSSSSARAALEIHDSLTFLRLAVGLAQLGRGRAGRDRGLAAHGEPAGRRSLAPALHPADAVGAARARRADARAAGAAGAAGRGAARLARAHGRGCAGALAAVAPFIKWPYALALIAIVLFSRGAEARRSRGAAIAVVGAGRRLHRDLRLRPLGRHRVAQLSSGRRGLDVLKGVWGQAFWSLIGLVVLAALVWRKRAQLHGPAAARRCSTALAVAMLATLITNTKDGTGPERDRPDRGRAACRSRWPPWRSRSPRSRWIAARIAPAPFTLGAQSLSLRRCSPNTATPFIYPSSERGAWGRDSDAGRRCGRRSREGRGLPARRRLRRPAVHRLARRTARCPTTSRTSSCLRTRRTSPTCRSAIDAVQPRCG